MIWLAGLTMALLLQPMQPLQPPAQQPCTYQACALAVNLQPFELVRGEEREALGRGLFGPDVHILLDAGGQAADWANSYRRYHTAQQIMGIAGVASAITAYTAYRDNSDRVAVSFVVVGALFGILEEAFQWKGLSRLNRAVWWYNKGLAEGAP